MSWHDKYPHTVYASVLLKDNKITNWKIGDRPWLHTMQMTRRFKLPFDMKDYDGETVESTGFEVNNSDEHNRAFSFFAKEWFKNWEVHENYEGQPAYKKEPNYFDEARKILPLSNCLKRQYACLIVMGGHIVAKGWNESLVACTTCARMDIEHNTGSYDDCPAVHAEVSVLIRERENSLRGAELYLVCSDEVDPIPCPACQKLLDWTGVKQVREVQG